MPYTPEFDLLTRDTTDYNVGYFFPPLYLYICVIGKLLQSDLGIGLILTTFGFITAFPIYGISTYLSGNRQVGTVAAATYLFSPIVLYHTVFEWLNPAPFVFFSMLSFYLLMHNRRFSGALAMTTSALFKQTAFFFALPLVAFLAIIWIRRDLRKYYLLYVAMPLSFQSLTFLTH
jgi:Gpi18-like mannosyltransferase